MPFTPFHMGAALIIKPALNRHFSVIAFGLAQIGMDIEPAYAMLTGNPVLHGPSHTVPGALAIATMVSLLILILPALVNPLLNLFNKEVTHYRLGWLAEPGPVSRTAIITGAFLGTLTHIALDGMMHLDMHPLAPFTQANPLLQLLSHDTIYLLCTVLGITGGLLWLVLKWHNRSPR